MKNPILKSILPVGVLGLFIQASAAWFFPESEIGKDFLNVAGKLFLMEFLFMHSAVFFELRHNFEDSKIKYWAYTIIIIFAYALFMIEPAQKDPLVWLNYIGITLGRIFAINRENPAPWIQSQLGISGSQMLKGIWILSLLKAGFYLLLVPVIVFLIPLPDFALSETLVNTIVVSPHRAPDLILLIKAFWFIYLFQTLIEFFKLSKWRPRRLFK